MSKTDRAHLKLSEAFKDKTIERSYLSILKGKPFRTSGKISTNIGMDITNRTLMSSIDYKIKKTKHAISHFKILESYKLSDNLYITKVLWKLETGRTHQIRHFLI